MTEAFASSAEIPSGKKVVRELFEGDTNHDLIEMYVALQLEQKPGISPDHSSAAEVSKPTVSGEPVEHRLDKNTQDVVEYLPLARRPTTLVRKKSGSSAESLRVNRLSPQEMYDTITVPNSALAEIVSWYETAIRKPYELRRVSTEDLYGIYLNDIGKYPVLKKEHETILAQSMERGDLAKALLFVSGTRANFSIELNKPLGDDQKLARVLQEADTARTIFRNCNLKWVVKIAKSLVQGDPSQMDVLQDGNLGMYHAVDKFDWRKGFKFSTYSTWWIKQAMAASIRKNRLIPISSSVKSELDSYEKTREIMMSEVASTTIEETAIAERLGISPERVRMLELAKMVSWNLSLEFAMGDKADYTLNDLVPADPTAVDVEALVENMWGKTIVNKMLGSLDEAQRQAIETKFGLDGSQTFRSNLDTARVLGISEQRATSLLNAALAQMKAVGQAWSG